MLFRSRSARLRAQGAEIAVDDMSDVERVAGALKDIQRAYYCPPFDPYMIQGAAAFAVAAKESRLEHRPAPSEPQFTHESRLWRSEHVFNGQASAAPELHAQRA